jgi:hypothetical protein
LGSSSELGEAAGLSSARADECHLVDHLRPPPVRRRTITRRMTAPTKAITISVIVVWPGMLKLMLRI